MRTLRLGVALGIGFFLVIGTNRVRAHAWEPQVEPPSEQIKKLEGKWVEILGYVDIDGDGIATESETAYLREVMRRAGVKVDYYEDMAPVDKRAALVVINIPPRFARAELKDPAKADLGAPTAALRSYDPAPPEQRLAEARSLNFPVIASDDASAFFGLAKDIDRNLKRFIIQRFAQSLERRCGEVRFKGVSLDDALLFLGDVAECNVTVDWQSLSRAGVGRESITLRRYDETIWGIADGMLAQAGGDKLSLLSDGHQLLVTTRENAALRRQRRPGQWMTPAELRDPPAEALAPGPTLPDPFNRLLPELRFYGTPLADSVKFLKEAGGAKFEVEWAALAAVKIDKGTPVDVSLHNVSLIEALGAVSASLPGDAAVFCIDKAGTAHLTTRDAAEKAADKFVIVEP